MEENIAKGLEQLKRFKQMTPFTKSKIAFVIKSDLETEPKKDYFREENSLLQKINSSINFKNLTVHELEDIFENAKIRNFQNFGFVYKSFYFAHPPPPTDNNLVCPTNAKNTKNKKTKNIDSKNNNNAKKDSKNIKNAKNLESKNNNCNTKETKKNIIAILNNKNKEVIDLCSEDGDKDNHSTSINILMSENSEERKKSVITSLLNEILSEIVNRNK
ncbi:hypothetical protein MHBO_001355 [Bonamia ostreae]|uniref:Uncharacterized protein n=1 Tax=Bonamia ostreae TaxID=126728 RepID=A0ABV2AIQ9_9EUKA